MTNNFNWKGVLTHAVAIFTFLVLTLAYFSPVLEGKDIRQADAIGSMGWGKDARDYHEESGEYSYWSNSMFSGMPCNYTYSPQPANVFKPAGELVTLHVFGASYRHIGCIFATFIGFYVLMIALGCKPWLSMAGAIVYTLGSYNFIIINAGHMNKSLVIATMAPLIGGMVLCYRRKLLVGALVTLLWAGLNIYWSHQQVSYYVLLTAVILALTYLVFAYREKWLPYYFKATGVLALVAMLAAAPAVGILLPTSDYAKDSMRGGSELKQDDGGKATGLDTDYAFAWSYGKAESMTLLIPNFYGASSHYDAGTGSGLYTAYKNYVTGALKNQYVDAVMQYNPGANKNEAIQFVNSNRELRSEINREAQKQAESFVSSAPTYWGDQPFTEGPVYAGAVVCFLFVLGLFVVRGPEKWWLLIATLFTLVLAWGRNLSSVNGFLFEYMPLYNKFRAPSMSLVITTMAMSALAVLAIKDYMKLICSGNSAERRFAMKSLFLSSGIVGALVMFFALSGDSLLAFSSVGDVNVAQVPEIYDALKLERASMLVSDAWRSFMFIIAAALLLFVYGIGRIKSTVTVLAFSVLFLLDMWPVSKRFLSDEDFMPKEQTTEISLTDADRQIHELEGDNRNYRVFDFTRGNPFNQAFTSYHHNSVGGYSPAKLARYQDLIDYHLAKQNMNVINMLNVKYFILPDGVMPNREAYGHCWLVDSICWVDGPKEEISAIEDVDRSTAYVDTCWKEMFAERDLCSNDTDGEISLLEYKNPGNIIYRSSCPSPKLAVFSEVYYKTWKAYIDGKEVTPIRANYVLRALPLPAGEHMIEFKCVDEVMVESHKWSMIISVFVGAVILLLVAFGICREFKRKG